MADPSALPPFDESNDPTPWRDPAWRTGFLDWTRSAVAAAGATVISLGPPRLRPWSVSLAVTTDRGRWWAKANPLGSAFEPALLDALARWTPGAVVTPVAVDAGRGFSLTPDGGAVLRDQLPTGDDLGIWEKPIQVYAHLQRSLAGHAVDCLRLGVPDYRPAQLPAVVDALLERGVMPAPAVRMAPLAQWCAELAASAVPVTLEHSDLHSGHVFTTGHPRFFDWGDANVGHPFASLLVILRSAKSTTTLAPDAPALTRLIDAYLEPWSDLATAPELRRTVRLALRVGTIARADSWQRIFDTVSDTIRADHHANSASWLDSMLVDDWSA